MPKKTFPKHAVTPSSASKKGAAYVSASNTVMPCRGEVTTTLTAENGAKLEGVKWQDADVNMPVLSVRKLAKKGFPCGILGRRRRDTAPLWQRDSILSCPGRLFREIHR